MSKSSRPRSEKDTTGSHHAPSMSTRSKRGNLAHLETSSGRDVLTQRGKQSNNFEKQEQVLSDLKHRSQLGSQSLNRIREKRAREQAVELQHLQLENEDLWRSLKSELENLQNAVPLRRKTALDTVQQLLGQDDRLLDDLDSALTDDGVDEAAERATTVERAHKLADILTKCLTEEVLTRLDRIYLENLDASAADEGSSIADGVDHEREADIVADIESLRPEVGDLTQMFVENRYRVPIDEAAQHDEEVQKASLHRRNERISSTLTQLTSRMNEFSDKLEAFQSYNLALEDISQAAADTETTAQDSVPRRLSESTSSSIHPSIEPLIQHIGISSRQDPASLIQGIQKRSEHLASQSATYADVSSPISAQLQPLREASAVLSSALHYKGNGSKGEEKTANSEDEEVERELTQMNARVTRLGKEIEDVGDELEQKLREGERAQRRFVGRWGRVEK
ncbi:MAG: hypothetical protein Q9227_006290 [Pyrenula ochraceoflavens]